MSRGSQTGRLMLLEANPYQVRVALLEDGRVRELWIEPLHGQGVVGNIYKSRVHRVLPGMEAAFVDIGLPRHAYLWAGDVGPELPEAEEDEPPSPPAIETQLQAGDEILVQVTKDPRPSKGSRVTARLSLPGRFLVWLPEGSGRGISRRIEDPDERQRLLDMLEEFADLPGGLIIRTAGADRPLERLQADLIALQERWSRIQEAARTLPAPALLWEEDDLALRSVRDLFRPDVDRLIIDGEEALQRTLAYLERSAPLMLDHVEAWAEPGFLFERYGVEQEIERARRRKLRLQCGGYIVIQSTEALVAIDVNTGRHVGSERLEDTVLQTNLEAAEEIAWQIRLRDLGGLIVIDFIDMEEPDHRDQVMQRLEEGMAGDRQPWRVSPFSPFGLVELTRRRARADLTQLLTERCPTCHGRGRIPDPLTTCLRLRRDLLAGGTRPSDREIRVRLHPEILAALHDRLAELREELEERFENRIEWQVAPGLSRHEYLIEGGA